MQRHGDGTAIIKPSKKTEDKKDKAVPGNHTKETKNHEIYSKQHKNKEEKICTHFRK